MAQRRLPPHERQDYITLKLTGDQSRYLLGGLLDKMGPSLHRDKIYERLWRALMLADDNNGEQGA